MSDLEDTLAAQLTLLGIPFEREVRLIPGRRWRWDFVVHGATGGYAVECQGGLWTHGAHTTGVGVTRDIDKANALVTQTPYRCLYVTAPMIESGVAAQMIERLVGRG